MGALCSVHPGGSGWLKAGEGTYVDFNMVLAREVNPSMDAMTEFGIYSFGAVIEIRQDLKARGKIKVGPCTGQHGMVPHMALPSLPSPCISSIALKTAPDSRTQRSLTWEVRS